MLACVTGAYLNSETRLLHEKVHLWNQLASGENDGGGQNNHIVPFKKGASKAPFNASFYD